MRTPIFVFLIIAAAFCAPWAANAEPTSSSAPISTPITPTTPITTDGNQDHVVGEDMC